MARKALHSLAACAALLPCLAGSAARALSFGLGSGAARAAKTVVDKAAQSPQSCGRQVTGLSGAVTLTASPMNPANVLFVQSLGNLQPPGHTFPSDHIYFYYIDPGSLDPDKWNVSYPVYAVADAFIDRITYSPPNDYKVEFVETDTFSSYFDHVITLDASILARAGALVAGSNCEWLPVKAGQLIGVVGGAPGQLALDVGVVNLATTLPYINPSHYGFYGHSDAPLKYYADPLRTALYGLVNRLTPDYLGSNQKDGIICYDVPGSVSGNWVAEGSDGDFGNPDSWTQQLAFVYDPVYSAQIRISFGGMYGGQAYGQLGDWAVQAGAAAPASVTVAGGPYGYQIWGWDPNNGNRTGVSPLGLLMVQAVDNDTLHVEYFPGSAAASLPFDAGMKVYTR